MSPERMARKIRELEIAVAHLRQQVEILIGLA